MDKKSYRWTKPICRCLNCKYNKHDICLSDKPDIIAGYKCQHFTPLDTALSAKKGC